MVYMCVWCARVSACVACVSLYVYISDNINFMAHFNMQTMVMHNYTHCTNCSNYIYNPATHSCYVYVATECHIISLEHMHKQAHAAKYCTRISYYTQDARPKQKRTSFLLNFKFTKSELKTLIGLQIFKRYTQTTVHSFKKLI